jgi:hypothetical protein
VGIIQPRDPRYIFRKNKARRDYSEKRKNFRRIKKQRTAKKTRRC